MIPLSKKNIYQIMQITGFKSILERKINEQGCEDYGSHDWSLIASRDMAFPSNLFLPFFLSYRPVHVLGVFDKGGELLLMSFYTIKCTHM